MPAPLALPVAEYAPDLPEPGAGSAVVRNVYPRTPVSYGALPGPVAQYGALGGYCQGGAAYRDKLGNVTIVASDETDLYRLVAGLSTWQNASKSVGAYLAGGFGWNFTYFNGDVIAVNYGNPTQVLTLIGGGNFSDLPGNPPRARYIAVVKNSFVVLGNIYDDTNGDMPQRLRWCAAGNHRDWPLLGTDAAAQVQSGAIDLLGPSGAVQGLAPDLINADCVVLQEFAVRRMTYSGPPDIFTMMPVENARGLLCPDSLVVNGGIAYYWGQDGICAFDGAESKPIGANKVDRTVYTDFDQSNLKRVVGVSDPLQKLIWWAYPSKQNVAGNPDRMLCYNWEHDRFSLAEVTCETLLKLLSIGYTLDELWTLFGYLLDDVPAPLDSEVWIGGRANLGMFDTDHRMAFFTGPRLAATVDTAEMESSTGGRMLVNNSRPMVDGRNSAPSVAIGHRERLQDTVTFTEAVALNAMGMCPVRTSGRLLRARITMPAGVPADAEAWTHISGLKLHCVPQGSR